MPRMWADKTVEELREEMVTLHLRLERFNGGCCDRQFEASDIENAIEDLKAEIGRRTKPPADAGD